MQQGQDTIEDTVTISRLEYDRFLSLESDLAYFKQQLADLQRMIFGSKSERFILGDTGQLPLFDQYHRDDLEVSSIQTITYQKEVRPKEKGKPIRALLPAHLPRQQEVIEPEGLEEGMKKIGEEVTEILEHIPAKLYVRRIVRPKYVKANTDGVLVGRTITNFTYSQRQCRSWVTRSDTGK